MNLNNVSSYTDAIKTTARRGLKPSALTKARLFFPRPRFLTLFPPPVCLFRRVSLLHVHLSASSSEVCQDDNVPLCLNCAEAESNSCGVARHGGTKSIFSIVSLGSLRRTFPRKTGLKTRTYYGLWKCLQRPRERAKSCAGRFASQCLRALAVRFDLLRGND